MSRAQAVRQYARRCPQTVLHGFTPNRALDQAVDPPNRICLAAHTGYIQTLLPNVFALTRAINDPGVLASATFFAAIASTGTLRGFHLMMKANSRCSVLTWAVISRISFKLQKPESARTSKGPLTSPVTMGKTRSKLYSLSLAEC